METGWPMALQAPFLAAVTLAAIVYLLGQLLTDHTPLRHLLLPDALLGGLLAAGGLLGLRLGAGIEIAFPVTGEAADLLTGALLTILGLSVTPRVLGRGLRLVTSLLVAATLLWVVHLAIVLMLPLGWAHPAPLQAALLHGPLSFIGAPYTLTPPNQAVWLAALLGPASPAAMEAAQAMMMIGVVASPIVCLALGHLLHRRAGLSVPAATPGDQPVHAFGWRTRSQETALLALLLVIVIGAFTLQAWLRQLGFWLADEILPMPVVCYLAGALCRLAATAVAGEARLPQAPLTGLLLGPGSGIVLTYAIMTAPLHRLLLITADMLMIALLAVGASLAVAWLVFPLLARFSDRATAATLATILLAVTTAWGPVGIAYLRRLARTDDTVSTLAVVTPPLAFYLLPWLAIGLAQALALALASA